MSIGHGICKLRQFALQFELDEGLLQIVGPQRSQCELIRVLWDCFRFTSVDRSVMDSLRDLVSGSRHRNRWRLSRRSSWAGWGNWSLFRGCIVRHRCRRQSCWSSCAELTMMVTMMHWLTDLSRNRKSQPSHSRHRQIPQAMHVRSDQDITWLVHVQYCMLSANVKIQQKFR